MDKMKECRDLFFHFIHATTQFGYTIFGEKPMSLDAIDLLRGNLDDYGEYKDDEWVVCEYRKKGNYSDPLFHGGI